VNFKQRRTSVLVTALLAYMLIFFQRTALTVIQKDLETTFHLSAPQFSSLAAVYMYLYAFMQIPSGLLADFVGPRKSISIGMFVAAGGSLLMAFSPSFAWLYIGRVLSSLGIVHVFICVLKLNAEWFLPQEFATLAGLTLFIGNFGALLASAPLSWLVKVSSWQTAFIIISCFTVLVGILTVIFIYDKPSHLGFKDHSHSLPMSFRETWQGLIKIIKDKEIFFPTFIYAFSLCSVLTLQAAWGSRMVQTVVGVGKTQAATAVMFISLGVMFGALMSGKLADKFGKKRVMNWFLGPAAILWLSLLLVTKTNSLFLMSLWMFLVAFCTGSGFTITLSFGKEIAPHRLSGIGMSIVNGGGFLFTAIFQQIYGFILDKTKIGMGEYSVKGFMVGNYLLIGSVFIAWMLAFLYGRKKEKTI
jgi:sugar phosphate permease